MNKKKYTYPAQFAYKTHDKKKIFSLFLMIAMAQVILFNL